MKLTKTLVATALFAAATFSQAAVYNYANPNFKQLVSYTQTNTKFEDTFNFAISKSDVISGFASFEATFGDIPLTHIKDGNVSFFKVGVNDALATLDLTNSIQKLTLKNLAAGSYFYKVTGTADGVAGGSYAIGQTVAPVPEPETYALMGMGLVGLLAARRRKAKQA